jgi:hypothetical protein
MGGNYTLPMMAIFVFLMLGATSTAVLPRRKWAPKFMITSRCNNSAKGSRRKPLRTKPLHDRVARTHKQQSIHR